MELLALAQVVLRRWWLLLLLGVLGVGVAYAGVSTLPKRYQSSVSLQLNPSAKSTLLPYNNANPDQATMAVAVLAASYSEVLRSRTFAQLVIDRLHLPLTPDALVKSIDARLIPSTNILRLNVTWDQPQDAQQLAQRIAELFITENVQQAQTGSTQRIQQLQDSARQMQTHANALQQQRDRLDEAVSRGDLSRLTDLNDLDTRLASLQTSYTSALVEIGRAQSSLDTAAIVDSATPGSPVGSLAMLQALLLGLVVGLAVGIGAALLLDKLIGAIHAPEDVAAVSGSAPLAAVGRIARPTSKGLSPTQLDPRLVVVAAPRSASAEAFRTLRTNLQLVAMEQPLRTVVVTSAGVGDGKSLVSANLAAALAQSGKRVLLVDGDLRRPSAHRLLGMDNKRGLVEVLLTEYQHSQRNGTQSEAPALEAGAVATPVENLFLLPSGAIPPNPSEILGSETTARLLADLAHSFDMVVIDTPPVGPVADALLLATRADGVLVVARAGQTRQEALRGALEALQATAKPILGVVMNDLQPSPLSRYGPYRYYYARYYGKHYYIDDEPKHNGSKSHTNGQAALLARPEPVAAPFMRSADE